MYIFKFASKNAASLLKCAMFYVYLLFRNSVEICVYQ